VASREEVKLTEAAASIGIGSFSRSREKAGDEGCRGAQTLTPTLSRKRERESMRSVSCVSGRPWRGGELT